MKCIKIKLYYFYTEHCLIVINKVFEMFPKQIYIK